MTAAPPSTPSPDLSPLEAQLCFAVYSAAHAFTRVYRSALEALGLTYPQYLVMLALWASDDRTVGALGDAMLLDSSTLTPLLKRLEAAGLVTRRRDPADERQVRVALTAAGEAMRDRARGIPACVGAATGLAPEAVAQLAGEIGRLRDRLRVSVLAEPELEPETEPEPEA